MTDQVSARQGKVHVCISSDRVEGDLIEEYTPSAAREFAAELLHAAAVADKQAIAIEAACADGHDWNDGSNLGEGKHAFTSWSCRREGCEADRTEPGHQIDDSEGLAKLLAALPPDDEFGRILLDFDGHPVVTVMGMRMSREDRIDGAAMRAHMQPLLRKAMRALDESVLGEALGGPALPVETCPTCQRGVVFTECTDRWHKRAHMTTEGPYKGILAATPRPPASKPDLRRDLDNLLHMLNQQPPRDSSKSDLLILGSCACQHPVTNHTQLGCSTCPCTTPVGKLATVVRDVETRTEPQ